MSKKYSVGTIATEDSWVVLYIERRKSPCQIAPLASLIKENVISKHRIYYLLKDLNLEPLI